MESSQTDITMNMGDRNPLLIGIVAVCALGVGVTGTMLWMQERAPQPTAVSVTSNTGAATTNTVISPSGAPIQPSVAPALPADAPSAPSAPSAPPMTSGETALQQANDLYDAQQWTRAITQYRVAIAGGLDNPDVRTDLGNALRFAGHPQDALDQYKIAQSQDSNHEQSLFNQGGLWAFSLHDPVKGVAAWRAYLKRFPNGNSAADARKFIKQNEGKKTS